MAIRNLVLDEKEPVAGCPPVVPASIRKNFTTAGLLCGGPEELYSEITTEAPGGKMTTPPLANDVYHFSKDKSTMVEWRIDTSAMSMPVFGRYEYTRYVFFYKKREI